MTALVIALGILVVLLVVAGVFTPRFLVGFRSRVARERAEGNLRIQDRMRVDLGRRYTNVEHVMKAETMPGWTWVVMTRRPPDPSFTEKGWRPTRRSAQRALDRRRNAIARTRARI